MNRYRYRVSDVVQPACNAVRGPIAILQAPCKLNQLLINKGGYTHVVEVDIKGCFDAIEHEKLLNKFTEHISDGKVLELISGFLKAGVMEELEVKDTQSGTPQGGRSRQYWRTSTSMIWTGSCRKAATQ